jgi:hypothetical protein
VRLPTFTGPFCCSVKARFTLLASKVLYQLGRKSIHLVEGR